MNGETTREVKNTAKLIVFMFWISCFDNLLFVRLNDTNVNSIFRNHHNIEKIKKISKIVHLKRKKNAIQLLQQKNKK